jgi:DNA-binding transcriptional LysR family regulator
MMDLHYLKIFNTVAKYMSFKKASEELHISQPAISIQVKKLENQSGLKLIYKIGNKLYLSDSGIMLYEYTKKIFAIVEEMENRVINQKDQIDGTINLGASNTPGTYILPYIIGEMKKRYPNAKVNLHIADTSEITAFIDHGTLDIAVNGGNCEYQDYIYVEKLINDRLVFVASPDNPLCENEYINSEDLQRTSFIVHNTTSQLYTYFIKIVEQFNIPENICMYLGSIDAIKHAVMADLGVSIMPYYSVKQEIDSGMLIELKMRYENLEYPYSLIYNKNKSLSQTTLKFIEILREACSKLD